MHEDDGGILPRQGRGEHGAGRKHLGGVAGAVPRYDGYSWCNSRPVNYPVFGKPRGRQRWLKAFQDACKYLDYMFLP